VGTSQDVVSYQDYARRARKMQRVHVRVEVLASTHRCCTGHGVCVVQRTEVEEKEGFEKEKVLVSHVAVGRVIGT
jgi:hypothetical protein